MELGGGGQCRQTGVVALSERFKLKRTAEVWLNILAPSMSHTIGPDL